MAEYHNPVRRVCAVCGYVLDELDGRWFHGIAIADQPDVADHPAIPVRDTEVPAGHVRARCDFCVADDPQYVLPARDFVNVGIDTGSSGDWAACVDCAELIGRNDWNGVIRRAVVSFKASHGTAMSIRDIAALRVMYRTLRRNVTGGIYRLEEADR